MNCAEEEDDDGKIGGCSMSCEEDEYAEERRDEIDAGSRAMTYERIGKFVGFGSMVEFIID